MIGLSGWQDCQGRRPPDMGSSRAVGVFLSFEKPCAGALWKVGGGVRLTLAGRGELLDRSACSAILSTPRGLVAGDKFTSMPLGLGENPMRTARPAR